MVNKDYIFNAKFNAFTGKNGIGKTNMLDAIFYLCTGKSYFNSNDVQLIHNEDPYFLLKASFIKDSLPGDEILCALVRGRKKVIKKNNIPYERIVDHYGEYPAIMIAPNDLELLMGGSEERRKWMDATIAMYDRQYLYHLMRYDKALQQRNAELKNMFQENRNNKEVLEIYNQILIPLAQAIFEKRKEFIAEFIPVFLALYKEISGKEEPVGISYVSQLQDHPMAYLLENKFRQDLIMQRTSNGTHKDDLDFSIFSNPIKKYGSQGQQKSFIFSLKLAQYKYSISKVAVAPILLLDDVCERLDESRLRNLMRILAQQEFGQIFISDTSSERILNTIPFEGDKVNIFELSEH